MSLGTSTRRTPTIVDLTTGSPSQSLTDGGGGGGEGSRSPSPLLGSGRLRRFPSITDAQPPWDSSYWGSQGSGSFSRLASASPVTFTPLLRRTTAVAGTTTAPVPAPEPPFEIGSYYRFPSSQPGGSDIILPVVAPVHRGQSTFRITSLGKGVEEFEDPHDDLVNATKIEIAVAVGSEADRANMQTILAAIARHCKNLKELRLSIVAQPLAIPGINSLTTLYIESSRVPITLESRGFINLETFSCGVLDTRDSSENVEALMSEVLAANPHLETVHYGRCTGKLPAMPDGLDLVRTRDR